MKINKKAAIAAALFSVTMNLSACKHNYDPSYNENQTAYGPPPEEWEYEETDTETVNNDVTTKNVTEQLSDIKEATENTSVAETDGIYYQPVSESEIGYVFPENAMVCFAFSYLYYNGSMYTSSYVLSSYDKAEIDAFADGIKGSELAAVYSNRGDFWSEDGSKLSDVDGNINGTICSAVGYDEDFRICVCYERYIESTDETYYGFIVFDKLNGITVSKGSDLFKDRLHLDEYAEVRILNSDENGDHEEKLSGDFSEFMQAILDGSFIEADHDTRESFSKRESYTLVFYTETGLSTYVSVYPDGYVSMTSGGNTFIEEVNPEACWNVIINYIE